ncbi:MAG: helix-turn-helix transcriptional regulator [Candidatus Thiodiazotropha endolucinida]|nr:helix-turn-helix transcriptional regulator [Candidatus Thiodiazotropha taylori]MCW4320733.1 helix-turn-helix transcriptional regulator [Candidatus Thiodiazotropha taylori]
MSQVAELLQALKRELRAKGVTYREVAEFLDLSENSVKRLFAERSFSIARLEKVCDLLGLELSDLVQIMVEGRERITMLTEDQEREMVGNTKLLLVAICVFNRWQFEQILAEYRFTQTELTQLLAKLDRLRIIELLPLNRFKLVVDKNFTWRTNGPIQRYFQKYAQPEFLDAKFLREDEALIFTNGYLSESSRLSMLRQLKRLSVEFNRLHEEDGSLPLSQRQGTSLMLAFRAWDFSVFSKLKRVG